MIFLVHSFYSSSLPSTILFVMFLYALLPFHYKTYKIFNEPKPGVFDLFSRTSSSSRCCIQSPWIFNYVRGRSTNSTCLYFSLLIFLSITFSSGLILIYFFFFSWEHVPRCGFDLLGGWINFQRTCPFQFQNYFKRTWRVPLRDGQFAKINWPNLLVRAWQFPR